LHAARRAAAVRLGHAALLYDDDWRVGRGIWAADGVGADLPAPRDPVHVHLPAQGAGVRADHRGDRVPLRAEWRWWTGGEHRAPWRLDRGLALPAGTAARARRDPEADRAVADEPPAPEVRRPQRRPQLLGRPRALRPPARG